jgi:ACS family sodium-dependent inorganic phosphate cotransporter-like MFS transporter 5
MSALPYIGMMFMSSTGKLFDILRKMNLVSLTNLRKIFNTVAFVIPAVSMFSLRLLNKDDSLGAIILLTVTMSFLQISTTGGFFLSHSELAGPYSGLIFGITNTAAQIPGFVTALMVAYLTPNVIISVSEVLCLKIISSNFLLISGF